MIGALDEGSPLHSEIVLPMNGVDLAIWCNIMGVSLGAVVPPVLTRRPLDGYIGNWFNCIRRRKKLTV